ncbi:MAG: hypothetical protein D6795_09730 [Deltaproteobacteria bacterium]|nr:MAG: hypothetical protein D6795_09730 [Deltaproteobacteria bacterium]
MIKINLLPSAKRAKPRKRKVPAVSPVAVIGGVIQILLVMLIIGVIHLQVERQRKQLQIEIARIDEELKAMRGNIRQIETYKKTTRLLRQKLQIIEDLKKAKQGPIHLMEELSISIPEKVWLQEFDNLGKQLKLKGFAVEIVHVSDFMQNLENSPYFSEVKLEEVTSEGIRGGVSVHRFELKLTVNTKPRLN